MTPVLAMRAIHDWAMVPQVPQVFVFVFCKMVHCSFLTDQIY